MSDGGVRGKPLETGAPQANTNFVPWPTSGIGNLSLEFDIDNLCGLSKFLTLHFCICEMELLGPLLQGFGQIKKGNMVPGTL